MFSTVVGVIFSEPERDLIRTMPYFLCFTIVISFHVHPICHAIRYHSRSSANARKLLMGVGSITSAWNRRGAEKGERHSQIAYPELVLFESGI